MVQCPAGCLESTICPEGRGKKWWWRGPFSRETSVLILDGPTSNLSIEADYELFCRFRELAKERTTVLVSHRFPTLRTADRMLVMEKGGIVESGSHKQLIANEGRYARLYRLHRRQTRAK